MKYRHAFHAGNFADVHKHVALLALIAALQRKDGGFLYIDTHAGRGLYQPGRETGAEARHGILQLERQAAQCTAPQILHYLQAVRAARTAADAPQAYPGSPLLAARALRSQDRAVCCELQPPECRALERAFAGLRRARCECTDGLRALTALLPPPEKRALVLIDPPYEASSEFDVIGNALELALARLANAVVAIWYPIKDERALALWLARVTPLLKTPALLSELWLYPRDARVALNGSGLLIVNPPYQFDQQMQQWLPELAQALDAARHGGGHAQRWIPHAPA